MRSDVTRAPTRTVRDADGRMWFVREYVRDLDGREDRSLLFDNGVAVRRVRNFPPAWHSLPDQELVGISRRR